MTIAPALFSAAKNDWRTPRALFDALDAEFGFTLDAAADETNHLVDRWLGPGGIFCDALSTTLRADEIVWLNCPYDRSAEFIEWADAQRSNGVTTVMLLPARTDTKVFHRRIYSAAEWDARDGVEIRFLKGRLRFETADGPQDAAPFPSMIVIFRGVPR